MTYHYDSRDLTDYLMRMQNCRQFDYIGVLPKWVPGTGDIEGFCHDEVVRQGHDPRIKNDGGVRIDWMLAAWEHAQREAEHGLPTTHNILALGAMIEPSHNSTIGFRLQNVYIGGSKGAHPAKLKEFVPALVARAHQAAPIQGNLGPSADSYRSDWGRFEDLVQDIKTADDWYLAFEAIHPFADGNGRSGKILHNLLLGSLNEPVLVDDWFGGGNP